MLNGTVAKEEKILYEFFQLATGSTSIEEKY